MYLTRLEIMGNPIDPHITQHPLPFTSHYAYRPLFISAIPSSPYTSPLASPTPHSIRSDSPVSFTRRTPPPTKQSRPPPGFQTWTHHPRSGSCNDVNFQRRSNSEETDLSKVARGAVSEGGW